MILRNAIELNTTGLTVISKSSPAANAARRTIISKSSHAANTTDLTIISKSHPAAGGAEPIQQPSEIAVVFHERHDQAVGPCVGQSPVQHGGSVVAFAQHLICRGSLYHDVQPDQRITVIFTE